MSNEVIADFIKHINYVHSTSPHRWDVKRQRAEGQTLTCTLIKHITHFCLHIVLWDIL